MVREMACLLLQAPLGRDPWVSSVSFVLSELDTMMRLEDVSKRYIASAYSNLMKFRADHFNQWVRRFTGEKRAYYENDVLKIELWTRYDGASDLEECQYRVWYTPKPADVPTYFWLGEYAEAA